MESTQKANSTLSKIGTVIFNNNLNKNLIIIRPTVIFGENNRGNLFKLMQSIYLKKFIMIGSGNNIKSIGILICGSGIGMCMAANKIPNIRCALVYEPECAILTRQHNDANVLALGARISGLAQIKLIIDMFLKTEFEGGRHQKRIDKL